VFATQENVRGIDRGAAVGAVEGPRPSDVPDDRFVAQAVMEQRLGRDDRRNISAHGCLPQAPRRSPKKR
jgi:hypothetical protein